MSVRLDEIIAFIENDFAEIDTVAKWDFSGRQVYLGDTPINKVLISLDPTEEVITEAINMGCGLIITHHPLFFGKTSFIDIRNLTDRIAIKAIQNNISILSYHTNIDISKNGINHYLASLINAQVEDGFLSYEGSFDRYKFIVYAPATHEKIILDAINNSNKTLMGEYSQTSFTTNGVGRFLPLENAHAYIGEKGKLTDVNEIKIETITEHKYLADIISAVKKVHPYEEVAFDIFKLENANDYGFGIVAKLDKRYKLDEFISLIKDKMKLKNIRTNCKDFEPFDKIAISSGSSVSSYKDCAKKGIKVLLTGDLKHHDAIDALAAGVCIIDGTHQHTEGGYMAYFGEILKEKFKIEVIIKKETDRIISWG